jgi:hypothetical protein
MLFFNSLFASTYNYYSKFKNEEPRGSSICVVFVSQVTLAILFFILIGKLLHTNLFMLFPNKYYYLPVFVFWFWGLYKYYSKDRSLEIMEEYKFKPDSYKKLWGALSIMLFILPTLLIFVTLKK